MYIVTYFLLFGEMKFKEKPRKLVLQFFIILIRQYNIFKGKMNEILAKK